MKIDLEKIREHADTRLGASAGDGFGRVAAFRRFLQLESGRLRMQHRFGLGGIEIAMGRSYLVDAVVTRAFGSVLEELGPAGAREGSRCAIVAVGGYGRRELAPGSDVDVIFLHPHPFSSSVAALAERLFALLWDVGLEVGSSFRSVAECVAMGIGDLHSRNSLTEARLVTGNRALFAELDGQMDACVYGDPQSRDAYFRSVLAEVRDREVRWGEVVCVQEPNVKESAGGLRDLHVVRWVGRTRYGARSLDDVVEAGALGQGDLRRALRAYDFTARIRNEAHFQTGRQTDRLDLEIQPALASALGYEPKGGLEASEIFMRDYYRRAQDLRRISQAFLLRSGVLDPAATGLLNRLRTRVVGPENRYEIRSGRLYPRAGNHVGESPGRLLEVFEVAQAHDVAISDELAHEVHGNLRLVNREFRSSPLVGQRFWSILGRIGRVGGTLRAMHESGFLGRYVPEFGRIGFLVQHDHYHRYTVDEHTIRALERLDALAESTEDAERSLAAALRDVRDPARLTLALLLHDVGKGKGGGHSGHGARIARRVAERLGLEADAASDVVFLVRKHLVMSQVSQRRDLSDPGLLEGFAETVSTLDRLRMLFLLTYVDTRAVAPGVWTEWKASLLGELYSKTRSRLGDTNVAADRTDWRIALEDRIVADLHPEYLRSDIEEFLAPLPDRYLRAVPADLIARHFAMSRSLGGQTVLTDWRATPDGRHTQLSVCLRDAPGVLSRLAGTLTAGGFDILSVNAFSSEQGVVVDVFRLSDPYSTTEAEAIDEARMKRIQSDLEAALEGRYDVERGVRKRLDREPAKAKGTPSVPPLVRFESPQGRPDDPGDRRTVIEIRADDEPGLVYRITGALSRLGLDISFAKIATEKNQALDVFYVSPSNGSRFDPAGFPAVEAELIAALSSDRTS